MYSSNSFQRVPSPTQSDIQSKRSHFKVGMEEELEVEKIQKLRRLDSPTSHTDNGINYVQVPSPKYMSQKTSPKAGGTQHRRSTSPKLFPPPIQKFLHGKGPTTASDALRKLKVPSKKNHRENLEKMHLLGLIQAHEVESSLLFRRSVSPSASQYSTSPITSPRMEVSPRDGNSSMAYEGSVGMQASPQLVPLDGNNSVNNFEQEANYMQAQTPASMMSSTMSTQSTYARELCQPSQNYYPQNSVGYPFQLNPENQMAYHNQQMNQSGGYHNTWNQGQQNPQNFQMMNNNMYENRNEQEGRERTTSFLGKQGVPFDLSQFQFANQRPADLTALKSKAEDQLATIHQLMQDKRKVSGGFETNNNKDMMQMFKKRNSNPEITMRSPEPQPLYPQAPRWRNSMEAEQCFANNTFGSNYAQQESFNREQFQFQGLQQQSNMPMHAKGDMFQEGHTPNQVGITQNQEVSNLYPNNGKSTTDTSNQDMFGFFSNEQNHQSSSQGHYSGSGSEGFLDPDAFLTVDHPQENEEFDMNITHTAVTFMPQNDFLNEIVPDLNFAKFNGPGEFPDDDIGI